MDSKIYIPPPKVSSRGRWIGWGLALAGVVGMAIGGLPLYRAGKGWRARQLASQVDSLIRAQKWEEATQSARAAYQLKSDEPAAIRAVAALESARNRPAAALPFWKQLGEMQALKLGDREQQASDLFRSGATSLAEKELESLLQEAPENGAILRLAAQVAAASGRLEPALVFAQRAHHREPDHLEGRLLLGLLKLEMKKPEAVDELLQLSEDPSQSGLEALLVLSRRTNLPEPTAQKLIASIRAHPLATEGQQLVALELEIRLHPNAREAILDRTVAQSRGASPEVQRTLGVWLIALRENARALQVVPLEKAFKRKDLLLVHLDALAALGRWAEIVRIVSNKEAPLDEVYKELFLARGATELGEASKADLHWRRAHLAAAPSPEQIWFLATYAEKIGQTDQAELAFRSLTSNATTARGAYEALLGLADKRKDNKALISWLKAMRERWPNDLAVRNDWVYFNALAGGELEEGVRLAQQLVEQEPGSLPHRTTLALALFRLGRMEAALAVYQGLEIPWERVPPAQRAVYAAVLAANQKSETARAIAREIPLAGLRPEEFALIERLRGS